MIELRQVSKSFASPAGERVVLDGVDLLVGPGEIVALAGRSGSGKTTLLTIAARWELADAGEVLVLGTSEARDWADLAVLPQSLGLLDELTIGENLDLPRRLDRASGRPAADAARDTLADELMVQLGIDHLAGRFPDEVSLGEQQRAALARAAVVAPRVLLADEPISHQNDGWARACMTILERLADSGTACLVATHNVVAFESATRVVELSEGRLRPHTRS